MLDFITKVIIAPGGNKCLLDYITKIFATLWGNTSYVGLNNKGPCRPRKQQVFVGLDKEDHFRHYGKHLICSNSSRRSLLPIGAKPLMVDFITKFIVALEATSVC